MKPTKTTTTKARKTPVTLPVQALSVDQLRAIVGGVSNRYEDDKK